MKKILLSLAALAGLVVTANAQVPTYSPQVLCSVTNLANAGTNVAVVIDCRKQQNVALQWMPACTAATGTNALAVADSVDGITYGPYRLYVLNGLVAGTNTTVTNINCAGVGYIKLGFITNWFSAGDITNCLVKYSIKISSP